MIVEALATGMPTRLKDTATSSLETDYAALRELVWRRFTGARAAQMAIVEHEKAPQMWRVPLAVALGATGAGDDEQIIEAARRVLALAR